MNPQDAPHILVIDDDPAFNRVLTRALGQRGFTVFGAADPENALELARQHEPEYVVLDLNIGGSSGLRLITPLPAANPACRNLAPPRSRETQHGHDEGQPQQEGCRSGLRPRVGQWGDRHRSGSRGSHSGCSGP